MALSDGKINLTIVAGICCSILFFVLLAIRLGLFQENRPVPLPVQFLEELERVGIRCRLSKF